MNPVNLVNACTFHNVFCQLSGPQFPHPHPDIHLKNVQEKNALFSPFPLLLIPTILLVSERLGNSLTEG